MKNVNAISTTVLMVTAENHFCHNWTTLKLQQDFDALCEMLSEFQVDIFVLATKDQDTVNPDGVNL